MPLFLCIVLSVLSWPTARGKETTPTTSSNGSTPSATSPDATTSDATTSGTTGGVAGTTEIVVPERGTADTLYSGPQPGERLLPFEAQIGLGEKRGKRIDFISEIDAEPLMLIFVHNVTRPGLAVVRQVVDYGEKNTNGQLRIGLIFLSDNPTKTLQFLQRARHAIPQSVMVGVSSDGIEGPGSYGLNRKMTLTLLLGREGRVTQNFALVQPSVAGDAPQIATAIEALFGRDKEVTVDQLGDPLRMRRSMRGKDGAEQRGAISDDDFRALMAPVIRRNATPAQVDEAARAVEARRSCDPAFHKRLSETAQRIIRSGRLTNYGTPTAQKYLTDWANLPSETEDEPSHETETESP